MPNEPANDALNDSKSKRGVDFRLIFAALIVSTIALVIGWYKVAIFTLPVLLGVGAYLTKDDPKRIDLLWLSRRQHASYQPRAGALVNDK